MSYPSFTKTYHTTPYPSISPTRKELSTAGKVILITGAGVGIGARIAHAFAASGSTSIAILGRTESTLISTKKSIEAQYPDAKILTFIADIVDRPATFAAFEATKSTFGPIDILVSNAGRLEPIAPVATVDVDEWFAGLEVNAKGNLIVAQAFLANAAENPILIHISTAGVHFPPAPVPLGSYSVGKAAAAKLLDYFAAENPSVRVIHLHPGSHATAMGKTAIEAGLAMKLDDIELPAAFAVWAASQEASFLRSKFVWVNWDVDELKARKEELVNSPQLTIGLIGWLQA